MNRIAKFEKVSKEQFVKDAAKAEVDNEFGNYPDELAIQDAEKAYEMITIPKRATAASAGYDFYSPVGIVLKPGETAVIPTGIRCKMDENWALMLYPRSGLGFKYRLQLANTVGVIDADYYGAANEGHIMVKITNDYKCPRKAFRSDSEYKAHMESKELHIQAGDRIVQGVFTPYGITEDDEADGIRTGGFQSTGKQ